MGTTRRFLDRVVVTAAHCLPQLPPAAAVASADERTYPDLLGWLGDAEQSVWAECLFVDPVADIALLAGPDNQTYFDQAEAFDEMIGDVTPLRVGVFSDTARAWLLSLERQWSECTVREFGGPILIEGAAGGITGGMSGSPILSDDGKAIGVVASSWGGTDLHTEGGPQPRLTENLPGWLLKHIV